MWQHFPKSKYLLYEKYELNKFVYIKMCVNVFLNSPTWVQDNISVLRMAESDGGWWSGQLSGIVNTIKQQSEQALRATQRDLAELVITVQADTSNFVSGATSQLGTYLWSRGDDDGIEVDRGDDIDDSFKDEETESYKPESDHELCKEPENPEFKEWKEKFILEQYTDRISELLADNSEVRGRHSTLVPSKVSNIDFWQRYFFLQHLTEQVSIGKVES